MDIEIWKGHHKLVMKGEYRPSKQCTGSREQELFLLVYISTAFCFIAQNYGFSKERTFFAAPPVGYHTSVNLLAIADLGQAEEDQSKEPLQYIASLQTTEWLRQELVDEDYQLLIHNGDISYAT